SSALASHVKSTFRSFLLESHWLQRTSTNAQGREPSSLARDPERQFEMKPLFFLKVLNHLEEIARFRIPARTDHPPQAFRGPFRATAQLFEPDRRVDVVAKDRLSGVEITGEKGFDAFLEQFLTVFPIASEACLHRVLELPRQRHFTSPAFSAFCSPSTDPG